MSGAAAAFTLIGTARVASGEIASTPWAALTPSAQYEWYAIADDGIATRTGPTSTFTTSATTDVAEIGRVEFALEPLTPNPAAGAVSVRFATPMTAHVRVSVYDVVGREVRVLADGAFSPGSHSVRWDGTVAGSPARSGMYFVRMQAPGFERGRRVAIVH